VQIRPSTYHCRNRNADPVNEDLKEELTLKKAIYLGTGQYSIDGDYEANIRCPYCSDEQIDSGYGNTMKCEKCEKTLWLNTD
jgi:hypothetical protein